MVRETQTETSIATPRDLFGGAMTLSLPPFFTDVSRLRGVPDNQEAFAHADTDRSLIVELLQQEFPLPVSHTLAATFHLDELASDSAALSSNLVYSAALPPDDFPLLKQGDPALQVSVAHGVHSVAKFKDAESLASQVNVHLACITLPSVTTDLLLVFNDPVALHPWGSSARAGSQVASPQESNPERRAELFDHALRTLQVNDWSLFC